MRYVAKQLTMTILQGPSVTLNTWVFYYCIKLEFSKLKHKIDIWSTFVQLP